MTPPSRRLRAGSPPPGSSPLLLAIETAGSGCSAAIQRGGEILADEYRPLRHGHVEALLPMVDRVARVAGIEPRELELVAVAIGPGGFTGIRAGLAAAQGIALASGARLVGVTSFAAVAAATRSRGPACRPDGALQDCASVAVGTAGDDGARALLVALDSRRADFYVQLFDAGCATPLAEPASVLPDRLGSYVAGLIGAAPLRIAGDLAESAAAALGRDRPVGLVPDSAPAALGVAAAALSVPDAGEPDAPVRPLYLRAPDVTLPNASRSGPLAGP